MPCGAFLFFCVNVTRNADVSIFSSSAPADTGIGRTEVERDERAPHQGQTSIQLGAYASPRRPNSLLCSSNTVSSLSRSSWSHLIPISLSKGPLDSGNLSPVHYSSFIPVPHRQYLLCDSPCTSTETPAIPFSNYDYSRMLNTRCETAV